MRLARMNSVLVVVVLFEMRSRYCSATALPSDAVIWLLPFVRLMGAILGRVVAQAVSHQLYTADTRVQPVSQCLGMWYNGAKPNPFLSLIIRRSLQALLHIDVF